MMSRELEEELCILIGSHWCLFFFLIFALTHHHTHLYVYISTLNWTAFLEMFQKRSGGHLGIHVMRQKNSRWDCSCVNIMLPWQLMCTNPFFFSSLGISAHFFFLKYNKFYFWNWEGGGHCAWLPHAYIKRRLGRKQEKKKRNIFFTPPIFSFSPRCAVLHLPVRPSVMSVRRSKGRDGGKRVECNATKEAAVGVTISSLFSCVQHLFALQTHIDTKQKGPKNWNLVIFLLNRNFFSNFPALEGIDNQNYHVLKIDIKFVMDL